MVLNLYPNWNVSLGIWACQGAFNMLLREVAAEPDEAVRAGLLAAAPLASVIHGWPDVIAPGR